MYNTLFPNRFNPFIASSAAFTIPTELKHKKKTVRKKEEKKKKKKRKEERKTTIKIFGEKRKVFTWHAAPCVHHYNEYHVPKYHNLQFDTLVQCSTQDSV